MNLIILFVVCDFGLILLFWVRILICLSVYFFFSFFKVSDGFFGIKGVYIEISSVYFIGF